MSTSPSPAKWTQSKKPMTKIVAIFPSAFAKTRSVSQPSSPSAVVLAQSVSATSSSQSTSSFEAVVGGVERYMFERFEFPRMCEAVYNKIIANGKRISDRDLKRAFRNNQAWGNELRRACDYLMEEGRIEWLDNIGTSNRPSPGWKAVEE
jgi:hypothetical protein